MISRLLLLLLFSFPVVQGQPAEWLDDFVPLLDQKSPPFAAQQALGSAASDDARIAVIADYFRKKQAPVKRWIIPVTGSASDTEMAWANDAVNHVLTSRAGTEAFGDKLPWFSGEKKTNTLSRFEHFDYLAAAYVSSKNEKYAEAMVRDMLDFVENVPLERAADFTVQDDPLINPFNWVLLQWRVVRWIDVLHYLRDSPSLSDADYLKILHHMWKEIDWLQPRVMLGMHNGTLGNLRTVIYSGLHYPEHKDGAEWLQYGTDFFRFFLVSAFYPGEFSVELTLGYSEGTLLMATMIYEGLPANLQARVRPAYEGLVDAHVGMMKPDRSLPRYGDHGAYDIRERILRRAGSALNRTDLVRLADDHSGTGFPLTSFPPNSDPYYLSGYYAMRDGWDTEAQYLAMDAGPYGTNHQHSDKLSIVVSADSADFIVDPGTSLYKSINPGPRYDLRFGFLHNVITIDGVDPNSGWDRHYGFDVLSNRWVTNDRYDFLEGTYEFRNNLIDVIWRRSVLFIRGEYWIVTDALLGSGEHMLESNFQLAPDITPNLSGSGFTAKAPNGASLQMSVLPDGLTPRVERGNEHFPGTTYLIQYPKHLDWTFGGRGWVGSFGNESPVNPTQNLAAPAVVFSGKTQLPWFSARVLKPSNSRILHPVRTEWQNDTPNILSFSVHHDDEKTVDFFTLNPASRLDGYQEIGDDRVLWFRTVDGIPTEATVTNRKSFTIGDRENFLTLDFDTPFEGFLKRTGTGWSLFVDRYVPSGVKFLSAVHSTSRNMRQPLVILDAEGQPTEILEPGRYYLLQSEME